MTTGRLRERLREVMKPRAATTAPAPVAGSVAAASGLPRSLEATLGGEWRSLESGRYYIVERRASAEVLHGATRVGDLAERLARVASDARVLVNDARPPLLFFDLETTGLNGGAGTYAFIVGMGSFDGDGSFVTRQYVMMRMSEERPMLQAVAQQLATSGALVSFNGKSFDAPLLETRFLFHRLTWAGAALPHVDMLHPARRFWRTDGVDDRASTCSLAMLERQVLGAVRQNDVSGVEAPARYFQFVRSGDSEPLSGVLEHNRLDLLSLAGLTGRLLHLVSGGVDEATTGREAFALGGLYERAGCPVRARRAFERALELVLADGGRRPRARASLATALSPGHGVAATGCARLQTEVLRALARTSRRLGRHDEAARWWRSVLDCPGCPAETAREAAEALAIHHEHRQRDLESARTFALRTLETTPSAARHAALRHRLARLERKLNERPALLLGE